MDRALDGDIRGNQMKLNVSVEMDWLAYDEEGDTGVSPDQFVKDAIVKGVMERISGQIIQEVQAAASKLAIERINDTITNMLANFLDQPVVITDKYGDVKERHESVREMMKQEFDGFLTQKVDKNGSPTTSCSYGDSYTRLTWLTDKRIHEQASAFMKKVGEEVDATLKKHLDAEAKARVSKIIMDKLDIKL